MKRILSFMTCLLLSIVSLMVTVSASPDLLVDNADLLTVSEEGEIRAMLDTISETYQMDVVIVTTESTYDKSPRAYADDYYDYNGYSCDGVLLLISMEDRDWWISTTGRAIDAFSDSAIDSIGELMLNDLSNGWYADAFETFAEKCEYYINGEINGFPFRFGYNLIVALIIGLVTALIVTLVMRGQLKSVRRQAAASNYVKANSLKLTRSHELFLYRNVSRVRKASSSSGSSTHSSSSGRSHGGGGGKF